MSLTRWLCLVVGMAVWAAVLGRAAQAADRQKVVVAFDFESKFDDGRYGQTVGEMIWKKISRQGTFVVPETMQDVRDLCQANGVHLTPATPLTKVKEVVRRDFDADVGIWGSVERAPGAESEIYDLVIKCADFTVGAEPAMIYQVSARTKSVSEIPHLYVKEMLDKLYGRPSDNGPAPANPVWEENWQKHPNLVVNGDFEKGRGGVPEGWEARGGQQREPLGNLVKWIPETGNPGNHVLRLQFPQSVGDSTGVMYYSKAFPVEEGARYRFQVRWRTSGPEAKVFIKCYDEMASEYKAAAKKTGPVGPGEYGDNSDLREVYRSQQNLKGPKKSWNTKTEDFTPKHTKYSPKWGKVMLYGYLGAGVVEFDDVVIKQIAPASGRDQIKQRRHSLETKVTIKEMEENERRGKEVRERLRKGEEEPSQKEDQ